jgi:hypothetical protein
MAIEVDGCAHGFFSGHGTAIGNGHATAISLFPLRFKYFPFDGNRPLAAAFQHRPLLQVREDAVCD